jgi:hypothetical protein
MKTGISPVDLLATPPEIFDHMVRMILGRNAQKRNDWERLNEEML